MNRPNENKSERETKTQGQKRRTSKLAIAALVFGVLSLWILGMSEPYYRMPREYILRRDVLRLSALIGLVLGTVAIVRIKASRGILKGRGYAIWGVAAGVVTVVLGVLGLAPRAPHNLGGVCGINVSSLGKAMLIYASEFNDRYPTADKWCDLLIAYIDVGPKQLVCPLSDVIEGESSYAMNKNVVGKKVSEIPEDVVLLFETNLGKNPAGRQELLGNRDWYKELSSRGDRWDLKWIKKYRSSEKVYKQRWNQVGGPEILTTENHKGKGCNILFNDGHVEFVKPERLGELKWEVEEDE